MLLTKLEDEHILLQRIAKSDEQAFKVLFMAYHHELGVFINSLLDDRESTLEVVQDIFTKVWTHRDRLPVIVDFTSYLFIITRNYTLNKIRQLASEQKKYELYKTAYEPHEEGDVEAIEKRYNLLEEAVFKLPPQQQKVFVLRRQGFKNPEIAKTLNISTDSVAKYQQLALKALSEYVKAYDVVLLLCFVFLGLF